MQIPPDEIRRVADDWLNRFTGDIREAFKALADGLNIDELTNLIESSSDTATFVERLQMHDFTGRLTNITDTVFRLGFQMVNPQVAAWAANHGAQLMTGVNAEMRATVRSVIAEGITDRMQPRLIARTLRQVIPLSLRDAERFRQLAADDPELNLTRQVQRAINRRADLIARTETMRAANMGQQLVWEQARLAGSVKVWIASPDSRLCTVCAQLDGQQVEVVGSFHTDVQADTFTGSGNRITVATTKPLPRPVTTLTPPAHPRCRCTVGIV